MFPHALADSSAQILDNLKASAPVEICGSDRRLMHLVTCVEHEFYQLLEPAQLPL